MILFWVAVIAGLFFNLITVIFSIKDYLKDDKFSDLMAITFSSLAIILIILIAIYSIVFRIVNA